MGGVGGGGDGREARSRAHAPAGGLQLDAGRGLPADPHEPALSRGPPSPPTPATTHTHVFTARSTHGANPPTHPPQEDAGVEDMLAQQRAKIKAARAAKEAAAAAAAAK